MSENQDIRWVQRLSNYDKAVTRLQNAARIVSTEKQFSGEVDDLLKEGLVQRFEYTQELAWKVMKDYEEYQGYTDVQGSREKKEILIPSIPLNACPQASNVEPLVSTSSTIKMCLSLKHSLSFTENIVETFFHLSYIPLVV